MGQGGAAFSEPTTGEIIVYTAENTVSPLIWRLDPNEIVFHSVPVRTVGEQESYYPIVAHMCYN